MPEIPELEAISAVLNRRLQGHKLEAVEVRIPVPIRMPSEAEFAETPTGTTGLDTWRVDKYLLTALGSGHVLATNLMLTGQQLAEKGAKLPGRCSLILRFEGMKSCGTSANGWILGSISFRQTSCPRFRDSRSWDPTSSIPTSPLRSSSSGSRASPAR